LRGDCYRRICRDCDRRLTTDAIVIEIVVEARRGREEIAAVEVGDIETALAGIEVEAVELAGVIQLRRDGEERISRPREKLNTTTRLDQELRDDSCAKQGVILVIGQRVVLRTRH